MNEKLFGVAVFLILLIISAGITVWVNYEKSLPGYKSETIKEPLEFANKFVLFINCVLALGLVIVSAAAFARISSAKFLLVMLAFGLFALEWILKIAEKYAITGNLLIDPVENILELGVLVLLAVALFKK